MLILQMQKVRMKFSFYFSIHLSKQEIFNMNMRRIEKIFSCHCVFFLFFAFLAKPEFLLKSKQLRNFYKKANATQSAKPIE